MKKIIILIVYLMIIMVSSCIEKESSKEQRRNAIQTALERAYFEGQRDYANGDIRIEFVYSNKSPLDEGHWKWVKSPWDDGNEWIFDPRQLKDGR